MNSRDLIRAATVIIDLEAQRRGTTWQWSGIWAAVSNAIEQDARHPVDVALAGIAAVRDPKSQTPASIRFPSHYTTTSTPGAGVAAGPSCVVCRRAEPACRRAAQISGDHHQFTTSRPPLVTFRQWEAAQAERHREQAAS